MQGLAVSGTGSSTILPAVEQRIGSSSQPLDGAGVDPAFIPGLNSPVSVDDKDSVEPEDAVQDKEEAAVDEPERTDAAEEAPEEVTPGKEAPEEEVSAEEEEAPAQEEIPDGPVFEASDRRAKLVADGRGVRLSLDDQECEFRWDEIGAVETETSRFGKRFTVTVHTPERRWYPIEIEADSRSRFKDWEDRLDEVLDAYFEDGGDGEGGGEEPAAPEKEPVASDASDASEKDDD
jgi:hypothetical protein